MTDDPGTSNGQFATLPAPLSFVEAADFDGKWVHPGHGVLAIHLDSRPCFQYLSPLFFAEPQKHQERPVPAIKFGQKRCHYSNVGTS